jgi:hypothetical protein
MNYSHNRLRELGINVQEIITGLPTPVEPHTIFISGSVIEGYGNAESDLDLFVVYPEALPEVRAEYTATTNLTSLEYVGDWRLDIESWSRSQIIDAARRFRECSADLENWAECIQFTIAELDLAHRINIGIPLYNEPNFVELRNEFDAQHFSEILRTRFIYYYGVSLEDATGAISSKQYGTALIATRKTLQFAVDALLAAHGETNAKDKWRFFKLEKLGNASLIDLYWRLELPCISQGDEVLAWARDCLSVANQIVIDAQKR